LEQCIVHHILTVTSSRSQEFFETICWNFAFWQTTKPLTRSDLS